MIQEDLSPGLRRYWEHRDRLPGAFDDIDVLIFDHILRGQARAGVRGDVLEIGAFMGKSAIVTGSHVRPPDRMIVCDVFETGGLEEDNERENSESYPGLTRRAFEESYARFVTSAPTVVQELSSAIRAHVPDGTVRFAHIDGGHLDHVVREDIANVRSLLRGDGVVAVDDYRALHTPGVAASVWAAVVEGGLLPVCLSEGKFYGTWDPETARALSADLRSWFASHDNVDTGTQHVAGAEVVVVANPNIWTPRRRVKAALPPAALALRRRLRDRGRPHLGA